MWFIKTIRGTAFGKIEIGPTSLDTQKAVIQRAPSNDDLYRNIHEMRLIKAPPSVSPSTAQASIIIHQFVLIVDARIFWPLALHIQNLATATIKFMDFLPPKKQPHYLILI